MGALCGKESKSDAFVGGGRTLDSAPEQRSSAPLPANKRVVGGPPRTLGGGGGTSGAGASNVLTPAEAARRAAEAREQAAKDKTGKLGQQLRQQKGMTDNEVNKQANAENERQRLIRENQEQITYN
ncbi:hypothetical protein BD289DRAFT_481707 [Coniella lustricola]|uniref:Uncharacterized protein n=1 Tax=Coniella lustricola TaxID=2025994 RepID=A0A2T3ABG9_9PEZI|nr:hypothetical protein BD289DRAFT_481707 [Coniella lustricola]